MGHRSREHECQWDEHGRKQARAEVVSQSEDVSSVEKDKRKFKKLPSDKHHHSSEKKHKKAVPVSTSSSTSSSESSDEEAKKSDKTKDKKKEKTRN